jgi:hypothetical protein
MVKYAKEEEYEEVEAAILPVYGEHSQPKRAKTRAKYRPSRSDGLAVDNRLQVDVLRSRHKQ